MEWIDWSVVASAALGWIAGALIAHLLIYWLGRG